MIAAWMLYAVVVSVPVALAAWGVGALLRKHGIAERFIWLGGVVAVVTIPLGTLLATFVSPEAGPGATGLSPVPIVGLPGLLVVPDSSMLRSVDAPLVLIWMGLTAVLSLRIVRALVRVSAARSRWTSDRIAGSTVWFTDDLGPAVFGLLHPRVLLPTWLRDLPQEQLDLVLLHEREHIRSRDTWALALTVVLRLALPWHVGLWYLTSGLRQALEIDCDRRVARARGDVASYGETVLAVARRVRTAHPPPLPAFTESTSFIKRRLLAMTKPTRTLGRVAAAVIAVLGVFAFAAACGVPLPTAFQDDEPDQIEIPTPIDEASISDPTSSVATVSVPAVSSEPHFTPYTVAPLILNRSEVVQAMEGEYPPLLRDAGIGGTVRVYFLIDEDGRVQDRRVDKSSGHPAIDQAAMAVAEVYEFSPALDKDQKVPVWVSFPITFQVR